MDILADATLLAHPDSSASLGPITDASAHSVGACLPQHIVGHWQPLAFFSKKLSYREMQWPAYYRELHAVYLAVQHFRHFLEAHHCTIFTDHKPLAFALNQTRERLPPVQLNQLSFIADVQHVSDSANVVADAMSRVDSISTTSPVTYSIDFDALASAKNSDAELRSLLH